MKKTYLASTLVTLLALTACNNSPAESSEMNENQSEQTTNNEESTNSSPSHVKDNSTDSTEDTSSSTEESTTLSTDEVINQVKAELLMKESKLPTKFPVTDTGFLTAIINKNEEQAYSVSFYQTDTFIPINDSTLDDTNQNISLIATVEGEVYADPTKQQELFPETSLDNIPDEMAVDLGQDIVGMEEGAAGSTYLQWKEGRWVFQIKTLSSSSLDNVNIARKMVDYLELNALPVPIESGRFEVDYPENAANVEVISRFEEGDIVYSIKTNEVPIDALMMTVVTE